MLLASSVSCGSSFTLTAPLASSVSVGSSFAVFFSTGAAVVVLATEGGAMASVGSEGGAMATTLGLPRKFIFFLGAVELGWPVLAALRGGGTTAGIVWPEELAAALEELAATLEKLAAAPGYFGGIVFGSIVR